ncbi:MAG: 2-oxoacid:ferredoxin oxidoreductase subunit beta [Gammaproteobacteria bacterium]|jgi:2-oxoglutarate ferredoxin oxidoreductase subunit beta|nr:2-oxoacid:ferredoxin oxidoreductase subunit beta [Gammaproteobacteria bacterium]
MSIAVELNEEGRPLSKESFASDQEVRWCPGCGDYAILASVQKVLPELGIKRENTVFISGIGCSSRFPYYLNTYGFHTIHGRAPTIATGLKIARPELSVWVITGDGDGLSIGTNHLLHLMRRNVDVTILLFNNRIYGLTKGQYSPTSEKGKKTKTTPMGSVDEPFDPVHLALAAGCSFVARGIDVDSKGLQKVLFEAAKHKGTSFVEIYQNCNVFNDGAFTQISDRSLRAVNTITLNPGHPLVFGQNNDKGLHFDGENFNVISMHDENAVEATVHQNTSSIAMAIKLNEMPQLGLPVPIGIFRAVERPTYEEEIASQVSHAKLRQSDASLDSLLRSGKTWTIS